MGVDGIGGGGLCAVGVDGVSELFGGLEEWDAFGWDVYLFSGLWVASYAGVALSGAEAAKATDFNFVAGLESADDGIEESVNDNFSVTPGEIAEGGDFVDKISFRHKGSSFRWGGSVCGRGPV